MDIHDSLEYKTTLGFNKYQHLHKNPICKKHPESPDRIEICRSVLQQSGLIRECQEVNEFPSLDDLDLRQSHSESHVKKLLNEAILMDQESLNHLCEDYDSVFMTPGSVKAAQQTVSCSRWLAEAIVKNKIPNAFALVRPPGHHANRSSASGFCLFNNAAQAAEAAFDAGADRILIVDLDVHHGNGTQQIFYEDKRIIILKFSGLKLSNDYQMSKKNGKGHVISIHRYENGKFWPHLEESNYDYIGDSEGRGYNVNIPLNEVGCGDADYMAIFWNIIWPLATQFNPDFTIISAGFDSCDGDPIGEMRLSPDAYSHIHLPPACPCSRLNEVGTPGPYTGVSEVSASSSVTPAEGGVCGDGVVYKWIDFGLPAEIHRLKQWVVIITAYYQWEFIDVFVFYVVTSHYPLGSQVRQKLALWNRV
ncbi:hypothetical protein KIN20_036053 [Parelaphostrongylus tenuis]|uniref:Histone deacetylase domain-containing protein n=1 Tax=Parelaphostrongylus tenuis TaxID=148309 RepID=A0AAD5WKD7_PARTN|nr:hypothetical protein KIN20_036053 [Parelaphostrongylus tenuis]